MPGERAVLYSERKPRQRLRRWIMIRGAFSRRVDSADDSKPVVSASPQRPHMVGKCPSLLDLRSRKPPTSFAEPFEMHLAGIVEDERQFLSRSHCRAHCRSVDLM